jgi:hypothetical protein
MVYGPVSSFEYVAAVWLVHDPPWFELVHGLETAEGTASKLHVAATGILLYTEFSDCTLTVPACGAPPPTVIDFVNGAPNGPSTICQVSLYVLGAEGAVMELMKNVAVAPGGTPVTPLTEYE